jgi:hypothetical protein
VTPSAVCLTFALWGLGAGPGEAFDLSSVTVKPKAVCMGPRHPPDKSIPKPEVVSTFPAQGAVVRPGYLVVRLTFNVAMSCDGVILARPPLNQPCDGSKLQRLVLSYDRRTIRMVCRVAEKTRYGLRLNYDPDFTAERLNAVTATRVSFMSLAGAPLDRFELSFSTSSGLPVADLKEAEAEEAKAPGHPQGSPEDPSLEN